MSNCECPFYYEKLVKKSNRTDSNLKFRNLNELVMFKCSSKAICETVGSIIVEKTDILQQKILAKK